MRRSLFCLQRTCKWRLFFLGSFCRVQYFVFRIVNDTWLILFFIAGLFWMVDEPCPLWNGCKSERKKCLFCRYIVGCKISFVNRAIRENLCMRVELFFVKCTGCHRDHRDTLLNARNAWKNVTTPRGYLKQTRPLRFGSGTVHNFR